MLFTSIEFLVFLPVVYGLYWLLRRRLWWQNLFIVVASYVFYGWWDFRFLLLIALTSLCCYASGIMMERLGERRGSRRAVAIASIVLNLLILGYFKYFNFFADSLEQMLIPLGWHLDMPTVSVILPVGISFYTFQALSYTIDVYRRKLPATHDVVAFFAFISFFPQLVAGPIERATQLLPQMLRPRRLVSSDVVDGLRQALWGFVKKTVVADNCALAVDSIWSNADEQGALSLWLGAFLFTMQIYADFSGYSDIAIGTARLFGIRLMRNFNVPYLSRNIAEFWRRWHVSLMTWLRDYVYIPLGGSRCSRWKTLRNTFVVFLVSGLWHGANWTFVCWGLYHGCLFVLLMFMGRKNYEGVVAQEHKLPTGTELLQIAVTFFCVMLGWVIFRSESMSEVVQYLTDMFTVPRGMGSLAWGKQALVFSLLMLVVEYVQRHREHALEISAPRGWLRYRSCRWALYYALLLFMFFFMGVTQNFIYFQF